MQRMKFLMLMVSIAIILIIVSGIPGLSANIEPKLINGDFENGTEGWGVPKDTGVDSSVHKSGAKSLKMVLLPGIENWASGAQSFDVEPNTTYKLGLWTKLQNVVQTHCKVQWLDANGQAVDTVFPFSGLNGDRGWFETSLMLQSPSNCVKAQIVLMAGWSLDKVNPGISWFDGIRFVKIKPTPKINQDEWLKITATKYGKEMIAPEMTEKVVYYDQRYDTAWVSNVDTLVSFLSKRGFVVKDADSVKSWMVDKIKNGADGTVCILAMGIVPDTITETMDQQCTFRKYMEAGGRIVWVGDIPLFYRAFAVQLCKIWGMEGDDPRLAVLGIRMGARNLVENQAALTDNAAQWGMQRIDSPVRTFFKEDVTLVFSDVTGTPYASSFFKLYNPEFPYSGFIRYFDGQYNGGEMNLNNDLYRLSLFRGKPIELPVVSQEEKVAKKELLTVETPMKNYRRGMDIPGKLKFLDNIKGDRIKLQMVDGKKVVKQYAIPFAAAPSFTIKTRSFASGDYTLRAEITLKGKSVAKAEKNIYLAANKTQKLPMGMYDVSGASTEYKTNIVLKDLKDHLGECGVLSGGGDYLVDNALRYGLGYMPVSGAYYQAMVSKTQDLALQMRISTGNLPKYHYGSMGSAPECMGNPINRERINKVFKAEIKDALRYPAFIKRMYVSDDGGMFGEPEEHLLACYCDYCKSTFKKLTGFDAPLAPTADVLKNKGVVSDTDPWYLWMKYRSSNTYGGWNASMEKAKNEIDPEIKFGPEHSGGWNPVFNPGWALNPPDDYGGIGMPSFYYYPQLYQPAVSLLPQTSLAIMGNRDKELWVTPQSSDYAGLINDPVMHSALVTNEFYVLLAAGVRGMTWFEYRNMPGTEAWEAMKPLSDKGTKFGQVLINLKRKTPTVAILASYANASYQWSAGSSGGDLYMPFMKAHIPTEYVADEEILKGALKKYKVLVLADVDFITKSVSDAIASFIAQGGIVFTDENCELVVPGGRAVKNAAAAEEVKKAITPEFDVNTPDLIATVFTSGGSQYMMFVNLNTIQPTTGEITLKSLGKYQAYDVFNGQSIKNNNGKISLTIAPAEGKLIGLYPSSISRVSIKTPVNCLRDKTLAVKIAVNAQDNKPVSALLPVKVTIRNPQGKETEYSDYYAAKDGKLNLSFTPAVNDLAGKWRIEAKELSSGVSSTASFALK